MPDVLGGLLKKRTAPRSGARYSTYDTRSPISWQDILTAPARAMVAQPRKRNIPGILGRIHEAIDPVQAFAGYGGMLAMALHPGRVAPAERLLGLDLTTTPARIVNKTIGEGGYTVQLPTGKVPEEGLMVGKYSNEDPRSLQVPKGLLGTADVRNFVAKNRAQLEKRHLGTWEEPETGTTYFD